MSVCNCSHQYESHNATSPRYCFIAECGCNDYTPTLKVDIRERIMDVSTTANALYTANHWLNKYGWQLPPQETRELVAAFVRIVGELEEEKFNSDCLRLTEDQWADVFHSLVESRK